MRSKTIFCISALLTLFSMKLSATNITNDFIAYGNVVADGLGNSANFHTNVTEYWASGSNTGLSTTGYLLVGGRYKVQHQNIQAGYNQGGVSSGTLKWTVTDTITGMQAEVQQQTDQPHPTAAGAIWTVRKNCLASPPNGPYKTLYEFLTPWGEDVLGVCYDLDSYFNFQGGGNLESTGNPTYYNQAGSAGGDILGLINIGNINNSTPIWEKTDLVAAIVNNPVNNPNNCYVYLLSYNNTMNGPATIAWDHSYVLSSKEKEHGINGISGAGTIDQNGNFGVLICIGRYEQYPTVAFIPVTNNGQSFGGIFPTISEGKESTGDGHFIVRPVWSEGSENTCSIQTWDLTQDNMAYNSSYSTNISTCGGTGFQNYANMGYVIRSGDNSIAKSQNETTQFCPENPSEISDPGHTDLLSVGIVIGIPPGTYVNKTASEISTMTAAPATNSTVSFSNTLTSGISKTNSYSIANNSTASLTLPCKYGSIGGSFTTGNTNSSSANNSLTNVQGVSNQTSSLNTLLLYGFKFAQISYQVWFLGTVYSLNNIHYQNENQVGYLNFPVITVPDKTSNNINNVTEVNVSCNYNNLPELLQGFDPPANNILTDNDWQNYKNKMNTLQKWVGHGVTPLAQSDTIYQGRSSGDSNNSTFSSTKSNSSETSKEHICTSGFNISLGSELSFGETTTKTFTTTSTINSSKLSQLSCSYGGPNSPATGVSNFPPKNLPTSDGMTINAYLVNAAICKQQVLKHYTPNGLFGLDELRPWFIPTYMWDNNRTFWIIVYQPCTPES